MNNYDVAISSDYLAALFAERAESAKRIADLERRLAAAHLALGEQQRAAFDRAHKLGCEVENTRNTMGREIKSLRSKLEAANKNADDLRNELLTAHALISTLVEYGASLENKIASAAQALAE